MIVQIKLNNKDEEQVLKNLVVEGYLKMKNDSLVPENHISIAEQIGAQIFTQIDDVTEK